jgi:hypothetical protein
MKIWDVIKELIFFSLYLMIVVVLSYGDQDQNGIYLNNNIESAFTGKGEASFTKVTLM